MSKNDSDRKIEAIHDGYLAREPARSRYQLDTGTSKSRDCLDENKAGVATSKSRDQRDADKAGVLMSKSRDQCDADKAGVLTSKSRDQWDADKASGGTCFRDARAGGRDKQALRREVDTIRLSLDVLKDTLVMQQFVLARDFEARIRHVYDDVINDLNMIRKRVNDIGDTFESETKFKTWTPLMPIRKEVLQSAMSTKSSTGNKLKGSKSVDFVDQRGLDDDYRSSGTDFDKYQSKKIFSQRQSWLGSSQSSITSTGSSRKLVPGFGCCFEGDGKTIPYRSHKARHHSNRAFRHSWGPSRSMSRSTLDDDDLEDKSVLCGGIPDDWRVKVAPYMWEGWSVPGIDSEDIHKLRERMEHLEKMRHEIVTVHNEYRQLHGCPELCVTTELAKEAQQWADILAMRGFAQYNDSRGHGENILVVDIEDKLSGQQVVNTWYRESRVYNYNRPGWQRGTTNFTQMIWKSSQFVGVGIAKFPFDNTYVIVVQYQPKGNVNTPIQFQKNVPSVIHGETQVFENNTTLQNVVYKGKNKSANGREELKPFHTYPYSDYPEMELEDRPEKVEIEEQLEKFETKLSNSCAFSRSENIENTIETNTSDGLDKLVAGLGLVLKNLTKRKRLDFDGSLQKENMTEDGENNDGRISRVDSIEKHDDVDDDDDIEEHNDKGGDDIEEHDDVGGDDIKEHITVVDDNIDEHDDVADNDIDEHDDAGGDDIKEHDDVGDDDFEEHVDVVDDGIEEHTYVDDSIYNDDNDLIVSVSASLASSVYDSSLTDGSSIGEIIIANRDRVPEWTSGKTFLRQSSEDRKGTSV